MANDNLPCKKRGCDGELVLIAMRACNQHWKCQKCQTNHYLSHETVAFFRKEGDWW